MNLNELLTHRNYSQKFFEGTVTTDDVDTKGDPFDVGPFKEATFWLDCTAFAGTSLDVDIVTLDPVSGKWFVVASFTQLTDVGNEMKKITENLGEKIAVVVKPVGAGDKTLTIAANFKII